MAATKVIRLVTSVAGSAYTYAAGQVVDAPVEIADDLIQAGHAIPMAQKFSDAAEKAVAPAVAKAEKR